MNPELRRLLEKYRKSGGVIQPTAGDVHVNQPLSNISVAYGQDASAFVASRVFAQVPVMKKSDVYYHYPRGWWNRIEMKKRAPATESAGANYAVSTEPYLCERWALHHDIDDERRSNADTVLAPDRSATRFLTHQGLLAKEREWANGYLKAGVWTFSADGEAARSATLDFKIAANNNVIHWSADDSTPIVDIKSMKTVVQKETGFRPNVLTIGRPVFDILTEHPDIIDRMNRGQTDGPAQANIDDLRRLFELDDILIMDAIYNSAVEGATDAHDFISGKHGLLSYRPSSPGLEIPAAGYTFPWVGYLGATENGSRMSRMRMAELTADRVEIEQYYTYKKIGADLGVFLNGIVA